MRLLIDMNLSPKWAGFLKDADFEAAHWSVLGAANAPDPELMAFAKTHNYVVLTNDLDFGAMLAASGGFGPSVVQIRADDLSIDSIGQLVVAALRQTAEAIEAGALVTIDPKRARVTLLPIA